MADTTPEEIERAKKWAAMQCPPVTVGPVKSATGATLYWFVNLPEWVWDGSLEHDELRAPWVRESLPWYYLALALRPVFNSVAPVLFEEAAKVCDAESDNALIPGWRSRGDSHDRELGHLIASNLAAAIRGMK